VTGGRRGDLPSLPDPQLSPPTAIDSGCHPARDGGGGSAILDFHVGDVRRTPGCHLFRSVGFPAAVEGRQQLRKVRATCEPGVVCFDSADDIGWLAFNRHPTRLAVAAWRGYRPPIGRFSAGTRRPSLGNMLTMAPASSAQPADKTNGPVGKPVGDNGWCSQTRSRTRSGTHQQAAIATYPAQACWHELTPRCGRGAGVFGRLGSGGDPCRAHVTYAWRRAMRLRVKNPARPASGDAVDEMGPQVCRCRSNDSVITNTCAWRRLQYSGSRATHRSAVTGQS
jgi:hypothetical protein